MTKAPDNLAHESYLAYHRSTGHAAGPWSPTLAGHWNAAAEAASQEARCGEFHHDLTTTTITITTLTVGQ